MANSNTPSPALRKATGTAIVKRFEELGVQASAAVDAWLPVLGYEGALPELTEEQGKALLNDLQALNRDQLSELLAVHAEKR